MLIGKIAFNSLNNALYGAPTAKTVREVRLEGLVKECIPHILREELSTRTSPKLRSLLERMKKEIDGD